jgi:redox-sensing transcriptional repressor
MADGRDGVQKEAVSELTTQRLSVYLRCLSYLEAHGVRTVSSHELARRFHLNSAQIRKDLAYFGELGIRGVGYDVARLKQHLIATLGLDAEHNVVVAGAGNLGLALAGYRGFNSGGFRIVALLDADPKKQEKKLRSGIPILPIEKLGQVVKDFSVEIGIIAVPGDAAQEIYDRMADAGICAVLSFAPVQIVSRPGIKLKSVDLRINLETLSFFLKNVPHCEAEDPFHHP